ncbi:predcited permease, major facilitator superfamily [Thermococcus kodakarensis KOD1]|uniref:Predcited permease, major facilitator superfamily n=1 Tax=Thermococcus kodakarensis (strain ATCC BAA-918 / JCM 12380 / KOD1) TaxID=69014 RepID=Q5JIW5_THEKO|nr:MFS transporter [Thermococcus kodakarensis]WCN27582.1 MFS transporter [Thermococcus kodakarensis]WCN29873.1 MFS transporter [Thermococcus kodakarensis]BAD85844.1 predcited permease, major facilitator superfamily [Thermococcus kodakarensis KOD1]
MGNGEKGTNERKIFGISWNVFLLGIVSFLNDMSSEMISPIVPSYLTDVLGEGKLISGSIMGAIESMSSLFKVAFGYVSDRFKKRKAFVFIGYALSTLAKGALAFTRSWWDFLTLRALDRIGKGIRTAPRDALIAESSEKGKSGKSFGFHRMMDTLGAVAGPLVAIGILKLLEGLPVEKAYRYVFLLSAVPGLISLLVILLFVKDRGAEVKKKITGISTLRDRNLQLFLAVVALGALGRYSYAFTLWKAEELGYTVVQGMAFYALFNTIYALSAYPIGIYSDRLGKKRMITAGFAVAALASLAFAYARDLATLVGAFALYGLYIAIEDTVPRAYMADLAKDYEKGTIIGAYHTVFGLFVLPASVIAGYLWKTYSLTYSFLFSAAMNLLALVLMLLVPER